MPKHWLLMDNAGGGGGQFRTRLAGAGRHLPATTLTTEDLMSATAHRTHIDLERLTGIHERRVTSAHPAAGAHFYRRNTLSLIRCHQ